MFFGAYVFSQIMELVPWRRFETCVNRYNGDYHVKGFKCSDYFKVMSFAQLTYRESLRDIANCFKAVPEKCYHLGISNNLSRNNLSNATKRRDWRIFYDFAQVLIEIAHEYYKDDCNPVDLKAPVFALDASTIDLCLSLFPWSPFRSTKAAVKLHTLLNLQGNIPDFIYISDGKMGDVNILDYLNFIAGAYYVMDRGYLDFERLYRLNLSKSFFVIRAKKNTQLTRRYSHPVDKSTGVQCDQVVVLTRQDTYESYPETFRRIRYYDSVRDKRMVFLTNNMTLPAKSIADLYKSRWRVELFFKWIKQHLRIKTFYGTSENAVKSQIWIGVCVYLLTAILKKKLHLTQTLHQILQILSLTQFEKTPILSLFEKGNCKTDMTPLCKQLTLFDL
jgi:transposase